MVHKIERKENQEQERLTPRRRRKRNTHHELAEEASVRVGLMGEITLGDLVQRGLVGLADKVLAAQMITYVGDKVPPSRGKGRGSAAPSLPPLGLLERDGGGGRRGGRGRDSHPASRGVGARDLGPDPGPVHRRVGQAVADRGVSEGGACARAVAKAVAEPDLQVRDLLGERLLLLLLLLVCLELLLGSVAATTEPDEED